MSDNESTVLSLRVSPDLASKFKVEAVRRNMRQNQLFEELFRIYQDQEKYKRGQIKGKDDE